MNLNDLEIREALKDRVVKSTKRFVITADPYDPDTIKALVDGVNVFIVHDKTSQRTNLKIWTRKSFDEFVKWFLKEEDKKSPFIVSHKFIKDGKPYQPQLNFQSSTGSNSFEGYNVAL